MHPLGSRYHWCADDDRSNFMSFRQSSRLSRQDHQSSFFPLALFVAYPCQFFATVGLGSGPLGW